MDTSKPEVDPLAEIDPLVRLFGPELASGTVPIIRLIMSRAHCGNRRAARVRAQLGALLRLTEAERAAVLGSDWHVSDFDGVSLAEGEPRLEVRDLERP